ncbi:hypothetical protein GGP72_003262 [Salinibacter ruber]|uniref:Uncharacterized protein n=1 Tax=Salinibacter ruber TaxID=146919 RepID=A0A9X2PYL0_9BACT|nr:hypothetical protein [Salinibacter ruber]MCS3679312.1 hypothetical protein [Salinibacter ruber]MCS3682598.1 hypothetical protein [Salinibacter ruber]
MSTDQPMSNQSTSSSQPDEEGHTGETEPGHQEGSAKEGRPIYLRPADEKELGRVVAARGGYKSVPHLLREYLHRSLIPRIQEGRCFPGRLLAETTGRASSGASGKSPTGGKSPAGDSAKGQADSQARTKIQLGLESWVAVEAAARALTGALRRLEERRAREGGAGALPFCRCGEAEVVRAAAREIATWSRGGPPELFSQESACRWLGPSREDSAKEGASRREPGREPPHQVLPILPGRERGGKPVQYYITEEAKKRLKSKGAQLGQTGSDLARRATRMLIRRVEEAPAEALRHITEESRLYREPREGETSGFQVYLAVKTKRRVERAVARLNQRPGRGDRLGQLDVLQAAARLAIETPDEKMRPPLPGASG